MKKYAIRIKELRLEKNLTQKELGIKTNISQSNIARYEQGTTEPTVTNLISLCDFFNVCSDYLIGRQDYL